MKQVISNSVIQVVLLCLLKNEIPFKQPRQQDSYNCPYVPTSNIVGSPRILKGGGLKS